MDYYNECFIDLNLPEPLLIDDLNNYFKKYYLGDKEAREIIIKHNIRLVIYRVLNKFNNVPYDTSDLVAVGIIGLIKCVDTFNVFKNVKFVTYATTCIDNQIISFIKKEKKHNKVISFEQIIKCDIETENQLKIKDILIDGKSDFVEECEYNELYSVVGSLVEKLSERDKKIVQLYFGLNNNEPHNQREVAKELNISQKYVSVLLRRILVDIREELINYGFGDDNSLILEKTQK